MRLIDADSLYDASNRAWNAWNLAMATADSTREINQIFKKQDLCKAVMAFAKKCEEINPETLPIVKELRAEIERLNRGIENLSKNVENAYKQRDGAVEQLRGICRSCKNYTENHCCGPCSECKHEYYQYKDVSSKDNWEWRGVQEDE